MTVASPIILSLLFLLLAAYLLLGFLRVRILSQQLAIARAQAAVSSEIQESARSIRGNNDKGQLATEQINEETRKIQERAAEQQHQSELSQEKWAALLTRAEALIERLESRA